MPAKKGTRPPNAGKGKPVGAVNRTTKQVREVLADAVDGQAGRIQAALDAAYNESPTRWWDMLSTLLEYVTPRLARSEVDIKTAPTEKVVAVTQEEAAEAYRRFVRGEIADVEFLPVPPSPSLPAPSVAPVVSIEPGEVDE